MIPCAQYDEVYIGETGRPLKTRISEHRRAVATGDVWTMYVRNANATHWMKTNHNMDWGGSTHGGQVKQVEGEEDEGKHVHQDQENVQDGFIAYWTSI